MVKCIFVLTFSYVSRVTQLILFIFRIFTNMKLNYTKTLKKLSLSSEILHVSR